MFILVLAAVMLAVLAAAEATVVHAARRRIRNQSTNLLAGLLRAYVGEQQRLRRGLRTGTTAATIAATAAALLVITDVSVTPVAIGGVVVFTVVSLLRSASRIVAEAHSEATAKRLTLPVGLLQTVWGPLETLVRLPVAGLLRTMGIRSRALEMDPAEELIGLLEETDGEEGALVEERRMMRGVLEMSGQTVRELMTPRTDVTALSTEATLADAIRIVGSTGFSRIPLYEESLDRIVGVVYAKDLLGHMANGYTDRLHSQPLTGIARPPYLVPETKRANELLADLRRDKVHMAIAVDEYGGTAGVITVEDLVEEIVGAITDEYDTVDTDVQQLSDDEAIVDASLTIDELNELFGSEIVAEDFDTVGGLIVTTLGRLALPGDDVVVAGAEETDDGQLPQLELRVLTILGRRIKKVRIQRHSSEELESVAEPAPEAEAV